MITNIIREYVFYDIDLKVAVNNLPVRLRVLVVMHLCGYTQQESSVYIGQSRSLVGKLLRQAHAILEEQLCLN